MSARAIAAFGILAITSLALAAEGFIARPGRWETTVQMDFGGRKVAQGVPFAEPMRHVSCVSPEEAKELDLERELLTPPDESCEVLNYRATSKEITYLVKCEEFEMDFKMTIHSPDSYTGIATSHGKNPDEKMVWKFSGRRTGNQCSAKELAEDSEDEE
jgi:hypothetical protein